MIHLIVLSILVLTTFSRASENSFLISFSPKKELSNQDYIEVQTLLHQKDIAPPLQTLYEPEEPLFL